MTDNKIKAWGVEQAIWGADSTVTRWFASKEERDKYYNHRNYCSKVRCRMVNENDVWSTYQDFIDLVEW